MIPCCFHPTRVVILADSCKLMSSVEESCQSAPMTFETFGDFEKALHYINEVYQTEPFYERYKVNYENLNRKKHVFKTQAFDTHQEIYRPQRFDEISTIVLDYSSKSCMSPSNTILPECEAIWFFNNIQNPHARKIVIIDGDEEIWLSQAINQGLVHYVVRKHDTDWLERLSEALLDAQWQYFSQLSEIYMKSVQPGIAKEYALDDPQFQKLFKAILATHGFTEAYLCEATGSYLFLDNQAQDHGLVVNLADQLDHWAHTGKTKGVSMPLLKDLKDRKKMMCYHASSLGMEPDKRHWDIYAHPVKTIQGRKTYYYAFAPNMYDIDLERVLPFEEYKESQNRKQGRVH